MKVTAAKITEKIGGCLTITKKEPISGKLTQMVFYVIYSIPMLRIYHHELGKKQGMF